MKASLHVFSLATTTPSRYSPTTGCRNSGEPVFELSDEATGLTYWVREIPTPDKAQELINEYGQPADEEHGNPYKQNQ